MIDEASKRRSDFVGGVPIRLEDGQEWSFPKPRVEYRIKDSEGEYRGMERARPAAETSLRFGDRFWKLRDDLSAAYNSDDGEGVFSAWGAVAVDLLRRNYDLSLRELGELLVIIIDDEANQEMWDQITRVALGLGPKQNAVG